MNVTRPRSCPVAVHRFPILARHAGLRVMGLALMTNMAAGLSAEALTHALTLQQAQLSGERAAGFLAAVVAGMADLPSLRA